MVGKGAGTGSVPVAMKDMSSSGTEEIIVGTLASLGIESGISSGWN